MAFLNRFFTTLLALVGVLEGRAALAQGFPDIVYELKEGSTLFDDCFCDRLPIEVPIRGTMVLQRLPVRLKGELYAIKELSFRSVEQEPVGARGYELTGTGSYYRTASDPDSNRMSLDAIVNGLSGIQIAAELTDSVAKFPGIDIKISESRDPARDPFHIYDLHLVAEPVSESVRYEVVEGTFDPYQGSFLFNDCDICGRPTIPIPVTGSFVLRHSLPESANPIREYTVEDLRMKTTREGFNSTVVGDGVYTQGGEVALLQSLDLVIDIDDVLGIVLKSGKVPVPEGVSFPEIQIRLEEESPASPTRVFRLELLARPATEPEPQEFRRGDANADGGGDISDAVFILIWRFSGGSEPPCLEAADTNGDGQHDLTDAVYLLLHLFQGGPEPPVPGLTACGSAKEPIFGCASYACE